MKSFLTIAMLLAAFAIVSACSRAEPPPPQPAPQPSTTPTPQTASPALDPCDKAETQAELNSCWSNEQREAERRADESFATVSDWLRRREQAGVLKMFEEAQAKWADYRDAHCSAVAGVYEGGSMAPMQEAHCRADLAESRRRALETAMSDAAN